jgi:hypothetical protein
MDYWPNNPDDKRKGKNSPFFNIETNTVLFPAK